MFNKNQVSDMEGVIEGKESHDGLNIYQMQYFSIVISLIFSIAGIYYFLNNEKNEIIIEKHTVVEKNTITEKPIETQGDSIIYSGGVRMADYIWSSEFGKRVTYKEANEFCYNLNPKGVWKIPDMWNIASTHADENGKQFENTILTGNIWYYFNMEGASGTWCYNPSINTMGNCESSSPTYYADGKEKYVRCITEYSNIDKNYISHFPGCKDSNIHLSNGQVWAACNLGATEKWDKLNTPREDVQYLWQGEFYQFSQSNSGFVSRIDATDRYSQKYFDPTLEGHDWGARYGKTNTSHKGPCPMGWHIPTIEEWRSAYLTVGNSMHDLRSALYLSETGYRDGDYGRYIYVEQGDNQNIRTPIYYWSSTVWDLDGDNVGYVAMLDFGSTYRSDEAPIFKYKKGFDAYAIRCIKDN